MRTATLRLEDMKTTIINMGYVGENEHKQIRFDGKKMFQEYPNASVSLTVCPPAGEAYPATIERDGDFVFWTITDSDLVAEGCGEIQLTFTESPHIAKSYICRTKVLRSLVPTGDIPSGLDDFITRADQLLDQVEEAFPAGGTTGQVLAKKSDADFDTEWVEQGSGGTSDYTDLQNKPQIGGVTLTGNKTLHDLGAAAESDIPDPTSIIDDTAGDGDTAKVWSADKTSELLSEIAKKADKTYNPNLNIDPYYTNVGLGIPQLDPQSNWGFSNTSEVYTVANGKLTYTQSDTNDKLYKAVSLVNGHDYYYYLDVTGSGSLVMHFAGYYTGEKYDNDYIEKSFTCGLTTGATYAQIRAKSTTTYTLGLFVLLDLTALGITLEEAKKLKDAIKNMSVINVMDYGAKGDGVTDDTDAIASAIKVCQPGGTVFIPGGKYIIKNIACKSDISIKGEGRATVLSFDDNVTPPSTKSYNCLTVKNVSNVYISDLTMDGNRTNNSASSSVVDADDSFNCIAIIHSDHVVIDNVWGHSAGYHGVIMVDAHHIEVKNSKFWDNGFRPIHGHSTVNDVKIINNEVWANGQGFEGVGHSAYDAIYFFDDVHRLEISDNYIHDSTNIGGIQIGGNYVGDGDPSSDIMIVGNIIKNRNLEDDTKSKYGIHIMGDCVTNLSILNNSITGDRGIFMNNYHDRGANKNVSIIGNTIYNCKTYGIYVTEAYYDCIVSNNQIVGGTQAGIQIEKNEKLTITGNVVVDYERGIHIKNGTDVVISNNVVERRGQSAPTLNASIKADETNTNVWMIYNIVGIAVINSGTGAVTLPS